MFNAVAFRALQDEADLVWSRAQLAALPMRFQAGLLKQREKLNRLGNYDGNRYIKAVGDGFKYPTRLASSNDELIAQANTRAKECEKITTVKGMAEICQRYGVELPQARFRQDGAACFIAGVMARLKCPLWWRRALRKSAGREIERLGIELGFVHRRAGRYASDETVSRRKQQKARNRALLASVMAVNEQGQSYTLEELAALGVSNPAIRRGELMTRISGFETLARGLGHVGEFYTITAPSRFHARLSGSGEENPKFDGSTPRQAQQYLCGVWAKARSALHRRDIRVYGFRVAEAHHDGTPHWHLLIFMRGEDVKKVREVIELYALQDSGNEAGAMANRFKAVSIDRERGTAAGYIAKYISKNIDAHGVEFDLEGNEAKSGAERVDAWAAAWGIRQFQQIGGAPVSVWRELRRLEAGDSDSCIDMAGRCVGDLVRGVKPNWAGFLEVMGGATPRRSELPLGIWKKTAEKVGRYGDVGQVVVGVVEYATGAAEKTRVHTWEIKRGSSGETIYSTREAVGFEHGGLSQINKGGGCTEYPGSAVLLGFEVGAVSLRPWSTVNNCTQKMEVENFGTDKRQNCITSGGIHFDAQGNVDGKSRSSRENSSRGGGHAGTSGRRNRNFKKSGKAGEG